MFGRNVGFTDVGSLSGWQAFLVATAGRGAVEIKIGPRGEQVSDAGVANTKPIDFLEDTRGIRIERLAAVIGARKWSCTIILPGGAIRLTRHVWQGVQPIFGFKCNFIHRYVGRALALRAELAIGIEIPIWSGV